MKKYLVLGLAVLAMVMLAGCSLPLGIGKTKLDTTKELEVTFSGANGYGRAEIVSNRPWSSAVYKKYKKNADAEKYVSQIQRYITYSLAEDYTNLSNGDTVVVNVKVQKEALKNIGFSAKEGKKEFKVKGLTDAVVIDAFEGLTLEFEGIDPNGRIKSIPQNDIQGVRVNYSIDKTSNLTIGDVITVKASLQGGSDGQYVLAEESKTFTVEKLDKYIDDVAGISDSLLTKMKDQANDIRTSKNANDKNLTLGKLDYKGMILLSSKGNSENVRTYCVFETTVSANDLEEQKYFWVVEFDNPIEKADGTQEVNVANGRERGESVKFQKTDKNKSNVYVTGYESLADVKNDIIDKNAANFKASTNLK